MQRKKIKIMLSILLAVITMFTLPLQSVLAYELYGSGYKPTGSLTSFLYYLDSSTNEYKDSINNGYGFWNGVSSKVKIYRTDYKADSRCDSY